MRRDPCVARRKRGRDWDEIERAVCVIRWRFPRVVPLTDETHAMSLAREHSLCFYDALIAAAAQQAGRDTLFGEDLQDGRGFSGLGVRNPFQDTPPG